MGRIVRLNISLDNSHSLDDFPVDLYSGLTSGDTTNLVYANIVSTDIPLDLMFEDSDLNVSNDPNNPFAPHCYMRISSDGCYDEIIKLEVPKVDCEMCVDFQEIIPEPTPTSIPPTPTSIPPTPTSIPPTPTEGPTPTPTPTLPPGPSPTPTTTSTPTPTPTSSPTPSPTPTSTDGPTTCNEYSLYMTGQGETSSQWEWTECGGSVTTWTNVGANYRVVCSETIPTLNYGDGFSLLNGDCGNYTVSRCTDGQQFTVAKNKNCNTGTPPAYSVGDIIQFKEMSVTNGQCFGASYCGTITATDSNTPHDALVSRAATVDGCDDVIHCEN
jgi:hypothetical protein